jgi:signal peptidase II
MAAVTLLLSALLLVALDQASKALVLARVPGRRGVVLGPVAIRRGLNRRTVRLGSLGALFLVESALLTTLVQLGPWFQGTTAQVALGAALGGAGGNLLDQRWRGGVVDFIDLGFWPVFNLADTAIVAGAVTGLWHM